ncbi:MAG: pyridoxal phosphate-dependent aminotransferase [Bacteroidetes bacterium]|jgi:aspartate/methionine/tyrosine aminotransferase|nr:pyridoxal phosphate-dependent aminotransferase [Bacteroidota bacterium]
MDYKRMIIEVEAPEQIGYEKVKYNLTESSISDTVFGDIKLDINSLKLCYGDHLGKAELRSLIVTEFKNINAENVLITAGAASALFIVATTLLEKEDHLIVIRPNYASNIETPRAIGCEISYCDLSFESRFEINVEDIRSQIKSNTKLISLTHPHNPTGMIISQDTLLQIAELAAEHNCFLLVDETYRELHLGEMYPIGASLHPSIITVSSVSKAYGLPGIRIGWLITQNTMLFEKFLAAKEQIFLCNSVIDEEIAFQYLSKKETYLPFIKNHISANHKTLLEWIKTETRMEMILPEGGVVCFPRIKNDENMDMKKFYTTLNSKYETFVGPGYWFEMPAHYMRIGFGWPSNKELSEGLKNISLCLDDCC